MSFLADTACLCFVFTLITINVFLSSQILGETDLTCEVSTSAGACAFFAAINNEYGIFLSLCAAIISGVICGGITMLIANKIHIAPVLASIIILMGAQSVLNKAIPLTQVLNPNVFSHICEPAVAQRIIPCIICLLTLFAIYCLLRSEKGLIIRMSGNSPVFASKYGVDVNRLKTFMFMLGNALCAIAGACIVMIKCSVNASIGSGTFVFGLAAILIGSKIYNSRDIIQRMWSCILGTICYKCILETMTCFHIFNVDVAYNNLLASLVLVVFLAIISSDTVIKIHGR